MLPLSLILITWLFIRLSQCYALLASGRASCHLLDVYWVKLTTVTDLNSEDSHVAFSPAETVEHNCCLKENKNKYSSFPFISCQLDHRWHESETKTKSGLITRVEYKQQTMLSNFHL